MYTKIVASIKESNKERDEALKKVPSNVDKIIKDIMQEMDIANERMDKIDKDFQLKVSVEDFDAKLLRKLDCDIFNRIFPPDTPA